MGVSSLELIGQVWLSLWPAILLGAVRTLCVRACRSKPAVDGDGTTWTLSLKLFRLPSADPVRSRHSGSYLSTPPVIQQHLSSLTVNIHISSPRPSSLSPTWQFHPQHLFHVNTYPNPSFVHVQTHLSLSSHYVTVVFKSWNIIWVTWVITFPWQKCVEFYLQSEERALRNMIEGDRAASRPLLLLPLINMLKTVNHCSPARWENHSIPW